MELEDAKKKLVTLEKWGEELAHNYKGLIKEAVEDTESSVLGFVKKRWEHEQDIFERKRKDLQDNNAILQIQLNQLKKDNEINEERISELEGEIEDLEMDLEKVEKERNKLKSRRGRPKK